MSATAGPVKGEVLAGKYRVEKLIGAGAMGWVLGARHVELETPVAIKLLRSDVMENPEYRERFRREARVVAGMKNEHVARVFDFGTTDSGAPYVAMELLEGCDLDAELHARGPLPVAETVGYFLQACEGIAEAHALGIVHRDLKPKNLFLVRRVDGGRMLKVLDFGVAKKEAKFDEESLTRLNDVIGTPRYMAPEQLRSSKAIDPRADVWALGVALYEALTGTPPFDGPNDVIVFSAILQSDPAPIRSRRPDVPPELDAIVAKCLSKDREGRYGSILELAVALEPLAPHVTGTSKRIHGVLSHGGENPLPLPLAKNRESMRPRLHPMAMVRRMPPKTKRMLVLAAAALGAACLLGIVIAFLTSGDEVNVPPATAVDPMDAGAHLRKK